MSVLDISDMKPSRTTSGNGYTVTTWTNVRGDCREPVTRAIVAVSAAGLRYGREFCGYHAYGMADSYHDAAVISSRRRAAEIHTTA